MEFSFASFSMAIVAVLMLLFGVICGVKLGAECARTCVTHRDYWIAHAKILGAGVFVSNGLALACRHSFGRDGSCAYGAQV